MYTGDKDPRWFSLAMNLGFISVGTSTQKIYRHGSAENPTLSYEVLLQIVRLLCGVPWEQLVLLGPFGFP